MSTTRGRTLLDERPSTASNPQNQVNIKSMIPKYRSLSQPPSGLAIDINSSSDLNNEDIKPDSGKFPLLEDDLFNNIPMANEDYKDCLESEKLELDSPSTTTIDAFHIGHETAADILRNLNLQEDFDLLNNNEKQPTIESNISQPPRKSGRTLSKKGSNSGIPVSLHTPGRSTPKLTSPKGCRMSTSNAPSSSVRRTSIVSGPPSSTNSATFSLNKEKTSARRNYDLFLSKKHRYDMLRRDMQDKYKAAQNLFTALEQLKNKLDNSGKDLSIEPLPFSKGIKDEKNEGEGAFDPKLLSCIKKSVEELSLHSVELCKSMLDKRSELLDTFENIARNDNTDNVVSMFMQELAQHKNDNVALQQFLEKTICEQETELTNLVGNMAKLTGDGDDGSGPHGDDVDKLHQELKAAQAELKCLQEKNQKGQEFGDTLQSENLKLKQKMAVLEKQIESEKRKNNQENEKFRGVEASTKVFKARIKELESIKQQSEMKIEQLSHDIKNTQKKMKLNEKNFEKELSELNKSRSMDKTVIDRLNRDKATFDTRVMVARQNAENVKAEYQHELCQLRLEVEFAHKECDVQTNMVAQFRDECERMKKEYNNLQMHAMQAKHLLHPKNDLNAGPLTDRECEMQVEIVAQRAAIKALQEKVDAAAMEKCRFIESIEQLNESTGDIKGEVVKSLVHKEEEITQLQQIVKKREEDLSNRRIENANLKVRVEHLNEQIALLKEADNADLEKVVLEGRRKLEEALAKSLDNEDKLARYESEVAQKIHAVLKLENTVKLRDGLIGLLKSKKDDLLRENRSLTKYSDEIRKFVLDAKEEVNQKTEIIQNLQVSLNQKVKIIHKMENYIEELEDKLALTNEKRYKLQDSLNHMEQELQHVQSTSETRTRNKCLKH